MLLGLVFVFREGKLSEGTIVGLWAIDAIIECIFLIGFITRLIP